MSWSERLNAASLAWLLEPDSNNPAIRYFAMRDLLGLSADSPDVRGAQSAVMDSGPVPAILDAQHSDGYWQQPGSGYRKYHGTVWQIMLLNELGADPTDARVQRGCDYLLNHSIDSRGAFSCNNTPLPGGAFHCLNGNLLYALIGLGRLDDPRVQTVLDWQVRVIIGEDETLYYRCGTTGPDFACAVNGAKPCGWGATKAMKALLAVPLDRRTSAIESGIERGARLLMEYNLAKADYPSTEAISASWFKLGFPLSYWSDILETLAVLVMLGYGTDPRLAEAYNWLLSKQDAQGRWKLENSLNRRMWIDIEKQGKPSKWITLRALRVIKAMDEV